VEALLLQHWTASELQTHRALPGYEANRRIALEAEVPVADDAAQLESALKSGHNPFRDDIHLNDAGQAALLELLLKQLQAHFPQTLTATSASR
jgi:lysophospholipase L1-like esterase